jgi:hypothetical protein
MARSRAPFNAEKEVHLDLLDYFGSERETPEGYRALLSAVLERGVKDALGKRIGNEVLPERIGVSRFHRNEARRWIRSEDTEPWTFLWVLMHLELTHLAPRIRRLIYETENF